MRTLDTQERIIVRELIKNPRSSDNKISRITKIPVKTVNIKRKRLEQEGLLHYYTALDTGREGTSIFLARHLYIVSFREGITKKKLIEKFYGYVTQHSIKHISNLDVGEQFGRAVIVIAIESRLDSDILEIFHADIVPKLQEWFGIDCIAKIDALSIHKNIRLMHNYIPEMNMERGIMKPDFKDELIFID